MTEPITIEDIINIWICIEYHLKQLNGKDPKAYEDIIKTYKKLLNIQITKGKENERTSN